MPYTATIIALVILIIVFSSQPKKHWKCPAPGCDFSFEQEKKAQADAHTLAHSKHQPKLQDE